MTDPTRILFDRLNREHESMLRQFAADINTQPRPHPDQGADIADLWDGTQWTIPESQQGERT